MVPYYSPLSSERLNPQAGTNAFPSLTLMVYRSCELTKSCCFASLVKTSGMADDALAAVDGICPGAKAMKACAAAS